MPGMRWNRREEDRLLRSQRGPVGEDLRVRAARVEAEQKRLAAVSPDGSHGRAAGYMRDSVTTQPGRDEIGLYADIGPTATTPQGHPYPLDVEFGTRPHTIPNAFGRGEPVQHPGTTAQPFMRPSIEAARDT
jgi:hypothetical protein